MGETRRRRWGLVLVILIVVQVLAIAVVLRELRLRNAESTGDSASGAAAEGSAAPTELSYAQRRKACPADFGQCLGFRQGDLDGDDKIDVVGLVFGISVPAEDDPYQEASASVHVVLGTGETHQEPLGEHSANSLQIGWIGIMDLNVDGRDDMLVVLGGGEHLRYVRIYEYTRFRSDGEGGIDPQDPMMEPMRGIPGGTFGIDNADSTKAGFTCLKGGEGRPQLRQWSVAWPPGRSDTYQGTERLWQADTSGVFRTVTERSLNYPAGPSLSADLQRNPGVNCPNLPRFAR